MYAAKIELGWVNKCFEGESPTEIIRKLEKYQDFGCLLNMGRAQEGKKGQKELDKLESFLNKYYDGTLSMNDIKELSVHLSIADIVCHGVAKGEDEIAALKAK